MKKILACFVIFLVFVFALRYAVGNSTNLSMSEVLTYFQRYGTILDAEETFIDGQKMTYLFRWFGNYASAPAGGTYSVYTVVHADAYPETLDPDGDGTYDGNPLIYSLDGKVIGVALVTTEIKPEFGNNPSADISAIFSHLSVWWNFTTEFISHLMEFVFDFAYMILESVRNVCLLVFYIIFYRGSVPA